MTLPSLICSCPPVARAYAARTLMICEWPVLKIAPANGTKAAI